MELTSLYLTLALGAGSLADSARLVNGRVLVEPLGISVAVPPLWLGGPVPAYYPQYWCARTPAGTVADRVVVERDRLPALRNAPGEWRREFSAVADSALPFDALVAQFGGDPWRGTCGTTHVRVYITDLTPAGVDSAAARGAAAAARFFPPVRREAADSAGWYMAALAWEAWYHDYGGTARVEFWARRVGERTLVLVFMAPEVRAVAQRADRAAILASLRIEPESVGAAVPPGDV